MFHEIRDIIIRFIQLWITFMFVSLLLSCYYGDIRLYLSPLYLPISLTQSIGRYHRLLVFESQVHQEIKVILLLFFPVIMKKITGVMQLSLPQWADPYVKYLFSSRDDTAAIPPLEIDQDARISQHAKSTKEFNQDNPSQLVYDPSMGVIPKGLQDLWNYQELERNQLLQKAKLKRKGKPLPPVRC